MTGCVRPARNAAGRQGKEWDVILDLGKRPDGRRARQWHRVVGTRRDAERERVRLLHELHTNTLPTASKLTVGEHLQRWLADARPGLAAQTYERYRIIVEVHLVPALGNIPLAKLSPSDVQGYYTDAQTKPREGHDKPLAARTVRHHHRVLRQALQHAVKLRLLAENPAQAVEPPRPRRPEMAVLSPEQIRLLLDFSRPYSLHVPIALSLLCGLRKGEVFGLRWQDIDFDAGLLHVRRSVEYPPSGPAFKEPKTARGRRRVTLPAVAIEILREHQAAQNRVKEKVGDLYRDLGLVCCQPDGSIVCNNVKRNFDNILRALATKILRERNPQAEKPRLPLEELLRQAGLPRVTFHGLRHSHATALLVAGVNPKVVSERLGHSDVSITLGTYSHVLPDLQKEAAAKIDGLFGNGQ